MYSRARFEHNGHVSSFPLLQPNRLISAAGRLDLTVWSDRQYSECLANVRPSLLIVSVLLVHHTVSHEACFLGFEYLDSITVIDRLVPSWWLLLALFALQVFVCVVYSAALVLEFSQSIFHYEFEFIHLPLFAVDDVWCVILRQFMNASIILSTSYTTHCNFDDKLHFSR